MKLAATAAQPGNPFSRIDTTKSSLTNCTISVGKLLGKVRGSYAVDEAVLEKSTLNVLLDWAESALKDATVVVESFFLSLLSITVKAIKVIVFIYGPHPSPQLAAPVGGA